MIKNNRKTFKINMLFLLIFFLLNGCAVMTFKIGGKFNNYKYSSKNHYTSIQINETDVMFSILSCGTRVDFPIIVLPIPILPVGFWKNTCEKDGLKLFVFQDKYQEKNSIIKLENFQISYNNKKYNSVFVEKKFPNHIYHIYTFKIPNYEEFKKAKDKTLIIHKKRDDGTTITKEIPFEWKLIIN